jgi:bifunctional N-acetylglucosamine-1-phosphate-uridyltransferase/glucosamine-1-phosphate-acetyltransferase GlmU-like protein
LRVIITFSGHSRRFKEAGFKEPKFLIKIANKPIINHVIEMFNSNDFYDLIFNKNQISQFPQIKKIIQKILPKKNYRIIEIDGHEMGPAFSINQLNDIPEDEKILISYCDFLLDWNYKKFIYSLEESDGAIAAFTGFHPASFGNTFYAYMKVNSNNELVNLREKKSFTNNRQNELASTGIYYFKKWSDFKYFYKKCLNDGVFVKNKEHYVSLIYNKLVESQLRVKVLVVKKFICLGTPEDLDQYLFWYNYFKNKKKNSIKFKNLVNVIPMAGKGKRFKNYGYNISKPLIQISGTPMVIKSCNSFPIPESWVFILKYNDNKKFKIQKKIENTFFNTKIISIKKATTGQAITCLYAKNEISDDKSIYVASADYELYFNQKKFLSKIINSKKNKADVVVFTKKLKGNLIKDPKAFGYCVLDKYQNVLKIIEKSTISNKPSFDPLIVGSFWFRSSKLFFYLLDQIAKHNIKVNNEHYIANGLNVLIEKNYNIVSFEVDSWVSFGDPFELELYYYWEDYFNEKK